MFQMDFRYFFVQCLFKRGFFCFLGSIMIVALSEMDLRKNFKNWEGMDVEGVIACYGYFLSRRDLDQIIAIFLFSSPSDRSFLLQMDFLLSQSSHQIKLLWLLGRQVEKLEQRQQSFVGTNRKSLLTFTFMTLEIELDQER